MKITYEFDPYEDKYDLWLCQNASKFCRALEDMKEYLRAERKHNCDAYSDKEYEVLEKIEDKFYEIINEHNIDFDEAG